MNKEQIKHVADVLKQIAIGQFGWFGGKNVLEILNGGQVDWVLVGFSVSLYVILNVLILIVLGELED